MKGSLGALIIAVFFCTVLMIGFGSLANAATELAVNGDFEAWTLLGAGGPPDDWDLSGASITAAQEGTTVYGGTYSTNLTWTTTTTRYLQQTDIAVTEGANYTFSFWAFDNDPEGRVRSYVRWYQADNSTYISASSSGYSTDQEGWQFLSTGVVTAPALAAWAHAEIRVYEVTPWDGEATAYVDDASFTTVVPGIALLREDTGGTQRLFIYDAPLAVPGDIGTPTASDLWVGAAGTDTEIMFMGAINFDDDFSADMLGFVRMFTDSRQRFMGYSPPAAVGGDMFGPLGTDPWVGTVGTGTEAMLMTTGNVDADAEDELIFIRLRADQHQGLLIYDGPIDVGGEINPAIASYPWVGIVGTTTEITALAAGDTDGDGTDELIFIRDREDLVGGHLDLEIREAPTGVGDDFTLAPVIASYSWIGAAGTNSDILFMASGDYDQDGTDEIFLVREILNGMQQLYVYSAPGGVGVGLGAPIATDYWIGHADENSNVIGITVMD